MAGDLLNGAKTIHSVRDGLEVMRTGLDTETEKLKKRREEGVPFAAIRSTSDSNGYITIVDPASTRYDDG